jgi:uncharacterized protein DUF6788
LHLAFFFGVALIVLHTIRREAMNKKETEIKTRRRALLEKLEASEEFRRGSVNVFHRKCGKKGCVCNTEGHPGHGPQTTLTFKDGGKTKARNLPTPAAVKLVEQQVRNHDFFQQWSREWVELNEEMADIEFARELSESPPSLENPDQKKLRRRSRKKSSVKSII